MAGFLFIYGDFNDYLISIYSPILTVIFYPIEKYACQ